MNTLLPRPPKVEIDFTDAQLTGFGGQPPDDLSSWLPWTMSEERRREFMTPE